MVSVGAEALLKSAHSENSPNESAALEFRMRSFSPVVYSESAKEKTNETQ